MINIGTRSDFSIGESLLQIDKLVTAHKEAGYTTVALADTMTVSALPVFTEQCKKAGVRPLIGARLRVFDDALHRPPKKNETHEDKPNPFFMPKAFPRSERGFKSLMRLLSLGHRADHFYYTARVSFDELLALEDCVITTGDLFGFFSVPMVDLADKLRRMRIAFGDDLYGEIVPIDTPLFDRANRELLNGAKVITLPLIASYPALYTDADQAGSLEVLAAICGNTQMDSRARSKQWVRDFAVAPAARLTERVREMSERLERLDGTTVAGNLYAKVKTNIDELESKCAYTFSKMPVCLPKMADDEFATLMRKAVAGWERRFGRPVMGYKPADLLPYRERLKYELETLRKMGFAGYFLLVDDLVNWAKANEVMVGPGRGSVGGSLVAYLLGITDVDPLRFNLLFERFINPERLDLPDADLDFMSSKRHLVIEYLREKYGDDKVAGISNYATLASGSALRDAGRVHGFEPVQLAVSKLIPKPHGQPLTLTEAADHVPELEKFRTLHPELWEHALNLEGAMRSFGQHAAGVVVAGEPLLERAVVETRQESPVVNWDKRAVEDFGLVKMDILGLSTLDVLKVAKDYIDDRHGGTTVDFLQLPLDDVKVLEAFGAGETVGIFQFESSGMRKLLKDLAMGGPLTFDDLAAVTALYRPGPMDSGLMDDYVSIRQGYKPVFYEHSVMEAALKDTNGVIIYQEQVMQLARDLAGFSLAGADHLRKAMGKKDKEKMAEQRQKWIDGCKATVGMDEVASGALFDKIEAFAGYGFNKSHAVEYTVISWWAMYLKVHYPAEFFAAALTVADDEDKLGLLVTDAKKRGFEVYPPDINQSSERYHISADRLIAPFQAVKGVSTNTTSFILDARKRAPGERFASREQFEALVNKTKVNARARDSLDAVGAFAAIEPAQPSAKDPVRLKAQTELLPGLMIEPIKAERFTASDKFFKTKVISLVSDYRACKSCPKHDQPHPKVRLGGDKVRFMVVFDGPSYYDGKKDRLLEGNSGEELKRAMRAVGIDPAEGYYTSLVKAPKAKDEKFYANSVINTCKELHFQRELELVKPPVILTLGSNATRHFLPEAKASEMVAKHVYRADLDATVVVGFNPALVSFDSSKETELQRVLEKLAEVLG